MRTCYCPLAVVIPWLISHFPSRTAELRRTLRVYRHWLRSASVISASVFVRPPGINTSCNPDQASLVSCPRGSCASVPGMIDRNSFGSLRSSSMYAKHSWNAHLREVPSASFRSPSMPSVSRA